MNGYTKEVLAKVCPFCCAAIGGKCLVKTLWGSSFRTTPHPERMATQEIDGEEVIMPPNAVMGAEFIGLKAK